MHPARFRSLNRASQDLGGTEGISVSFFFMAYDPFSQIQCEDDYCVQSSAVVPVLNTVYIPQPNGKLFGFDESFVLGVVMGILVLNFVEVMEKI